MNPRRIYPAWLPPTSSQREGLVRIRRRQLATLGWMVAFLPAGWIAALTLNSNSWFVPLTFFWITVGVVMARRVSESRCPRCDGAFCTNPAMPFFFALFAYRCENCGLSLRHEAD